MKNIISQYHHHYINFDGKKVVDVVKQLQKIVEETNEDVVMEIEGDCMIDFVTTREETDTEYTNRLKIEANHTEDIKQRELNQLRALKEKYGDVE